MRRFMCNLKRFKALWKYSSWSGKHTRCKYSPKWWRESVLVGLEDNYRYLEGLVNLRKYPEEIPELLSPESYWKPGEKPMFWAWRNHNHYISAMNISWPFVREDMMSVDVLFRVNDNHWYIEGLSDEMISIVS
jgi:hypothetical protein